jgi:hypothetical protein
MIFSPTFVQHLPDTHALLQAADLTIHPSVEWIILHGSRGLAGDSRLNSDLDLCLIVDLSADIQATELAPFLQTVFEITFNAWKSGIELNLAVIFETHACALHCFTQTNWREGLCTIGGMDCFGLYKTQKGFTGLVTNAGIQVKRMYPCLEIWQRTSVQLNNVPE